MHQKEEGDKKVVPHFWNLNEDPALTGMIVHFARPGNLYCIEIPYLLAYTVEHVIHYDRSPSVALKHICLFSKLFVTHPPPHIPPHNYWRVSSLQRSEAIFCNADSDLHLNGHMHWYRSKVKYCFSYYFASTVWNFMKHCTLFQPNKIACYVQEPIW